MQIPFCIFTFYAYVFIVYTTDVYIFIDCELVFVIKSQLFPTDTRITQESLMSHTGTTTKGLCAHPGWNMPVQRDSEMPKVCESESTKSRFSPSKTSNPVLLLLPGIFI